MDVVLAERRSPTLHDFPYRGWGRKCYHKWIVNVTPPGKAHCIHSCLYCYARDAVYSRPSNRGMIVYADLPAVVEDELSKLEICPPLSISNVTDPCQDVPELRRMVKRLVEVLIRWGVNFHIITKGDPSFLEEVEGFPGEGYFFLAVTIEGPPEVLRLLSPAAPPYERRLEALRWATSRGLPALLRLDPVVLPLWRAIYGNKWKEYLAEVLADGARAGARHVVSSTGRFTASTMKILQELIVPLSAREARALGEEYAFDRAWTSAGYMLSYRRRIRFHRWARALSENLGMTYAVCQELPAAAADSPSLPHCEGFSMPFSRRTDLTKFEPIPGCTANCHAHCAGPVDPPCGRPELARPEPFRPILLKPRSRGKRIGEGRGAESLLLPD